MDAGELSAHYVPRAGDAFARMREEREEAASQINRSLRAWRKAKDDDAQPAYVPQSTGQPIPGDLRRKMEPRLGADLSSVKLHLGGESAEAAQHMGARAFTVGSDVHFNKGEFAPGTKEGDRLIAHELTHVAQGQRSGVQRKAEEGAEEHGEHEVSSPEEPAEKEADAKGDAVADELHGEGDKEGDNKKDEKGGGKEKGDGKNAKAAANDPAGDKKEGGEKKEGAEAPKEAAPAAAAKLYAKLFLKPKTPPKAVDPALKQEMDTIKAWIEKEAAKVKTMWSAAAVPVGTTLAKIGAGVGTLAAPGIGTAIGGAAGAVAGALVSIFGISKQKHHVMEEKAKLLDNIDALVQKPEVIHELYDYIMALNPDFSTIEKKIAKAATELTDAEKKKAEYDKKKQARKDKQAGKTDQPGKADKAAHAAHGAAEKVETAEAGMEVGAAGAEVGAHALGEGAEATAKILETAGPVLEQAAHVAGGVAAALNVFVTGVDAAAWADKTKKFNELKQKAGGGT